MKKSLFALAAVGAIAGTAQAQSSVTVYGIMDLGYVGANTRISGPTAVTKTTTSAFTDSAESTSRLGFKGNEDLGGGMAAFFTVETALTPNAQNAISSATSTANRQSFVGLKKNGIGQFALGTQYTSIHNAVAATDPGMQNNMMGNVIYDKNTGATTTLSAYGIGNNTSYTVRANNMLTAATETISGFNANAFYMMNNKNATETSTNQTLNNQTGWGLGANYTWNKLLVTANYQSFKSNTDNYTTPAVGFLGGTSVAGTNVSDNQQYYAATYDFGILKAYAQYVNRKVTSTLDSSIYASRSAQQIGVRSFITPTVESWASMGNGRVNTAGTGQPTANILGFQLGTNYWLSKRTNLYAIYGQAQMSNAQTGGAFFTKGTASQNMVSAGESNYAIGVRHTF